MIQIRNVPDALHRRRSPKLEFRHARSSRDLADRVADRHPLTITLPLEAARRKAREIIDRSPHSGLAAVIEKWRQFPDGRIEFAIRHFPAED